MIVLWTLVILKKNDNRNAERALIMANGSEFRQFSFELVESRWFSIAILAVILVNTAFIGLQTSEYIVAKAGTVCNRHH